ncbi:N,N-dimethylformamidase beta subunit family domain-containing protein [Rhodobacter sp. 24-YEA-8]|uniref:N,N-dimethylformamidase beta subunit family domain-containing protein n=1 Tax=Rhodobacter sp. 24-YEA-8 TaxID=1884310 RepID=UPI0008982415|nr:N,N-dimethylformamidase beta subunit family domain-containing protein [Rhodobacter sp. 24-YEA-8]SED63913.1 N,N-dimethylformamidase [Rhodobacter sp. 24-YEA-8]
MPLHGYFENWTLRAGDTARLAISTEQPEVRAKLVRFVGGPGARDERALRVEDYAAHLERTLPGRVQDTAVGSWAELPLTGGLPSDLTVHCWIWPAAPDRETPQTIWSLGDFRLELVAGRLQVTGRDGSVSSSLRLTAKRWYSVAVRVAGNDIVMDLRQSKGFTTAAPVQVSGKAGGELNGPALMLSAAGHHANGAPVQPFNGKVDLPRLYAGALSDPGLALAGRGDLPGERPLAAWALGPDHDAGWGTVRIAALHGQAAAGRIFNGAEKAVTGRNWNGETESCLDRPDQYQALQFHDDDVEDAGWDYDLDFTLPADLRSGVYAVQLDDGKERVEVPFFLAAAAGERAPVLFLVPTNTYLAYGNDRLATLDLSFAMEHQLDVDPEIREVLSDPRFGRSVYDTHGDGTPARYASARRSLVTSRPTARSWLTDSYRHFATDLYYIEWLEQAGIPYHVATDELLEIEGRTLLDRYSVVVTGSHPEYWESGALHALQSWLGGQGRMIYLGGNGFYWVTTRFPDRPWVMEIRRDNGSTRSWDAPFGERRHASTAELGGIWRLRGRAPNMIAGIGFAAEGWGRAAAFKRLPASYEGEGSRFFVGIEEEIIGDQGYILGGAVADEVDRFDLNQGSPAHAEILATSTPLGREYQLVIEDTTLTSPNQDGVHRPDMVRADIVYFRTEGGGEVLSAGSIACIGAVAWNGFDNPLARMLTNVLRDFAGPGKG